MSKGLEALVRTFGSFNYYKSYEIIEKELKALEIIKEKRVDVYLLILAINELGECIALNYYNCHMPTKQLTQEQFDLLKEVLK